MKNIISTSALLLLPIVAYAEMTQIKDKDLIDITGQDGVDIGLDVSATIGEIVYIDTEENGDGDGGAISFKDIFIGGANRTDFLGHSNVIVSPSTNLDDINIQVDALANGELQIQIYPIDGDFTDFKFELGAVELQDANGDTTATLFSSMSFIGLLENADILVYDDASNSSVAMDFSASVALADVDIESTMSGFSIVDGFVCGENCIETMGDPNSTVSDKMADISGVIEANQGAVVLTFDPLVLDLGAENVTLGESEGNKQDIGKITIDNLSFNSLSVSIKGKE